MFEKASRLKVRFNSRKGMLSPEDLWDLSLVNLNLLAKGLNKQLKTQEEEDFLEEVAKDDVIQLQFDLVIHVLKTKQEENKKARTASDNKKRKEQILAILAKKRDDSLEQKSEEELLKELEAL